MSFVVIGAGSIGSRHVRNLIALGVPPIDIHAIDKRAESLASLPDGVHRWGADSIDEVISWMSDRRDPNFLICSPAETHPALIRAAIQIGRPFFVEKPPALRESDLTDDEWNTGVPHVVGYNWRWHRGYRRADALARSAAFVKLTCLTNMTKWPGTYAHALAECSHEIDLALRWCGPIYNVRADYRNKDLGQTYGIDLFHDSGQLSRIVIVPNYEDEPKRFVDIAGDQIVGDLGRLLDESYVDEIDHFRRVCDGAPSLSTLEEARWVVAVFAKVHEQLHGSEVVR